MLLINICTFPWWLPWLLLPLLGLLAGWLLWGKFKGLVSDLEAEISRLNSRISVLDGDLSDCRAKRASLDSELTLLRGQINEGSTSLGSSEANADLTAEIGRLKGLNANLQSDLNACLSDRAMLEADLQSKSGGSSSQGIVSSGIAAVSGDADESGGTGGDADSSDSGDSDGSGRTGGDADGSGGTDGSRGTGGDADSSDSGDSDGSGGSVGDTDSSDSGDSYGSKGTSDDASSSIVGGTTAAAGIMSSVSSTPAKRNIYSVLKADNLQVVEGIGPKMDQVLKKHGIHTWKELGASSPEALRALLDKENPKRYRIIDPGTWASQAKLADEGNWEELIRVQKVLDTGRARVGDGVTDSKVEKLLIKLGAIKKWKQDDLKAIEGIGPKISGLLIAEGIDTWRKLSQTSVSRIQEILDAAGPRYKLADPGTWPKQSEMAAEGRWDDLDEYQEFLNGGK